VIVCGSRGWSDRAAIAARLEPLTEVGAVVVHGGARGADRIAGEVAVELGLELEVHPADWDQYGKRAGYVRNVRMARLGADLCIAFWDGASRGTQSMIGAAHKHGIPVEVVRL